jgi:hypothetical protein
MLIELPRFASTDEGRHVAAVLREHGDVELDAFTVIEPGRIAIRPSIFRLGPQR